MNTIIEVNNVSKYFGKGTNLNQVLDHACMYVAEGEFVSLMGASGSGKSTLLYLIDGLDRSFDGNINLCGEDIGALKDAELSKLVQERLAEIVLRPPQVVKALRPLLPKALHLGVVIQPFFSILLCHLYDSPSVSVIVPSRSVR